MGITFTVFLTLEEFFCVSTYDHTVRKLPSILGTRFYQGIPPHVLLPTHGQAVELTPKLHCETRVGCELQGFRAE